MLVTHGNECFWWIPRRVANKPLIEVIRWLTKEVPHYDPWPSISMALKDRSSISDDEFDGEPLVLFSIQGDIEPGFSIEDYQSDDDEREAYLDFLKDR